MQGCESMLSIREKTAVAALRLDADGNDVEDQNSNESDIENEGAGKFHKWMKQVYGAKKIKVQNNICTTSSEYFDLLFLPGTSATGEHLFSVVIFWLICIIIHSQ